MNLKMFRGPVMQILYHDVKHSGFSDMRGSGHFSGRITWGLVAAGVMAKKITGSD